MAYGLTTGLLSQIWKAVRQLNPSRPVGEANRLFSLSIVVNNPDELEIVHRFLMGTSPSDEDMHLANRVLRRHVLPLQESERKELVKSDIVLAASTIDLDDLRLGEKLFFFDMKKTEHDAKAIIECEASSELRLALGRHLPVFRDEVARRTIRDVSMENAVFVVTTALGDVIPVPILPLIGIAEAASDTVVLTANQVRMLFILGAIYGAEVGYGSQWREISSIVGAGFGWRALARELVSKIPFGGGLIPKGAIAYAGTMAVGEGLIFYFTTGRKMTAAEASQSFKDGYSKAVDSVRSLVQKFRPEGNPPNGGNQV